MRNGFGLKLLHKFFNLPFLQLQRETLLKQLETNEEETKLTVQEIDLFQEGDDADYNKFLENLVNKRRAIADSVSASVLTPNITSSLSTHQISPSNSSQALNQEVKRSLSMPGPIGGGTPIPVKNYDVKFQTKKESFGGAGISKTSDNAIVGLQKLPQVSNQASFNHQQNLPKLEVTRIVDETSRENVERRDSAIPQSLMSKIFGNKKDEDVGDRISNSSNPIANETIASVEDFVPDDGLLDRSFLDDNSQSTPQKLQQDHRQDSER